MENNICPITVIKPDIRLRPYVRYYYILNTHEDIEVLTFPLGCPQIIFHKNSPLFIPELSSFQDRFTISGQVNFPAHVASLGATEMIVAVFHPHTIGTFIQTPPSAFYNREIAGYDLENSDINELAARVFDTEDNNICVRIIEKWLLHKLASARYDFYSERMGMAIRALMNDPSEKINALASKCCLGPKQFSRVFNAHVGMMPKEYARIVRFQKVLWMLQNDCRDYTEIAFSCGYSDQSHLIREFREFSTLTPTSIPRPYSNLFSIPS